MSETNGEYPISKDLLDILRDPLAVQEPEKYGDDPGRLELVRGHWLVSNDTGLKDPIRDGIPVMLIDEGMKWKDTAVDDLPVPPPNDKPAPVESSPAATSATQSSSPKPSIPIIGAVVAGALGLVLLLKRVLSGKKDKGSSEETEE
jgi:uncharacterized protein YbaR (Trm112 family)